ncbi:hypothetical protein IAT38_000086 [Cryptococcus sp. DSM 104549]
MPKTTPTKPSSPKPRDHVIVVGTTLAKINPFGPISDGLELRAAISITKQSSKPTSTPTTTTFSTSPTTPTTPTTPTALPQSPQPTACALTPQASANVCQAILMASSLVAAAEELHIAVADDDFKATTDITALQKQWRMTVYELAFLACTRLGPRSTHSGDTSRASAAVKNHMGSHIDFQQLSTSRSYERIQSLRNDFPKAFISFFRLKYKFKGVPELSRGLLEWMCKEGDACAERIEKWVLEGEEKGEKDRDVAQYIGEVYDRSTSIFLARGLIRESLKKSALLESEKETEVDAEGKGAEEAAL